MTIIVIYAIKQKGQGHVVKYIPNRVIKYACNINQIAAVRVILEEVCALCKLVIIVCMVWTQSFKQWIQRQKCSLKFFLEYKDWR